MQYQVPQFIETEDRIVGPLTLRQFIYVAAAGGVSVFLFFTTNFVFWIGATIIVGGIGGALAFIQINGQPMAHVILSAFRYAWRPQIYVGQPDVAPQGAGRSRAGCTDAIGGRGRCGRSGGRRRCAGAGARFLCAGSGGGPLLLRSRPRTRKPRTR